MSRSRMMLVFGMPLALLVVIPAAAASGDIGSSAASWQGAGGSTDGTISASAKKIAKKALRVAKKADRRARKAQKAAKSAAAAAESAQQSADLAQSTANEKLPKNGALKLSLPPSLFVAKDPATVAYSTGAAELEGNAVLNAIFVLPVAVPVELLGQKPTLESVDYCYDATDVSATLDNFAAEVKTSVAGDVDPSGIAVVDDPTDRNDSTCRTVTATTPTELGPNDIVEIVVRADFSGMGKIRIFRVTANFTV